MPPGAISFILGVTLMDHEYRMIETVNRTGKKDVRWICQYFTFSSREHAHCDNLLLWPKLLANHRKLSNNRDDSFNQNRESQIGHLLSAASEKVKTRRRAKMKGLSQNY